MSEVNRKGSKRVGGRGGNDAWASSLRMQTPCVRQQASCVAGLFACAARHKQLGGIYRFVFADQAYIVMLE